jgi:hypothetical protein
MTKVKSNHIISHCVVRLGRRSRKGFFPTDSIRVSLKSRQTYQCWFLEPVASHFNSNQLPIPRVRGDNSIRPIDAIVTFELTLLL